MFSSECNIYEYQSIPKSNAQCREFSTTWIEHTSKIWKSSYPYTFYRTSFDDDFEDYKSCESEDDFYSCDSNESDVEELKINFRETSQVNINIDTLSIQLKFTVGLLHGCYEKMLVVLEVLVLCRRCHSSVHRIQHIQ
jgi:hypothetical protein